MPQVQLDIDLVSLEQRRAGVGVTQEALCVAAGISVYSYRRGIKGRQELGARVLRDLREAFGRLSADVPGHDPMIRSVYRAHLSMRAAVLVLDVRRVMAAVPPKVDGHQWGEWAYGAEARKVAVYLCVVALRVTHAEMARVVGVSRPAVTKMLHEVEDARDDEALDAELTAYEHAMIGEVA